MIFDVVIPTYNNLSELKLCIKGFEQQTFKDFRLIICINGYEDGTVEYLSDTAFSLQTVICQHPNRKNNGRPANRNLALGQVQAKFICFFDSDLVPAVDLLKKHYDLLSKQEDCVSVGSVTYLDKNNIWANYLSTRGANKYKDKQTIPFQYFNTQNAALKSEYFVNLQGFDPLITAYGGDDTEFSYRLNKMFNLPTIVNKAANGTGLMHKSIENALKQMREFGEFSLFYITNRHPDFKQIFNVNLFNHPFIKACSKILESKLVDDFFFFFIKYFPPFLKLKIIHWLVFKNIYAGYNKAIEKKTVSPTGERR